MVMLRFLITGTILACLAGAGSLAVLGLDDVADDLWQGRGRCHGGGYREGSNDGEGEPPCHRDFERDEE
ncbi:MAG: hypothetical protein JW939_00380, partial [Candidatus Thermoplasmatota archaeon]|nr:hypothetical protein [Candidatus Thermoplasmatota archaeon]